MRVAHLAATPPDSAAVREAQQALFTSGVPGTWVTAAQCSPERAVTEPGVTIYLHGGGFSFSNPPMEQILTHRLSQVTGRPAFAVDYRLAPTHPFPAALEDVVAVHRSLRDQGVPADRILLVGESAGATLVLSALLVLAEAGDATPAGAVAVSPLTDFAAEASPSIEANTGRDVLNPDVLVSIGTQYLAGARPDRAPQSPSTASSADYRRSCSRWAGTRSSSTTRSGSPRLPPPPTCPSTSTSTTACPMASTRPSSSPKPSGCPRPPPSCAASRTGRPD